MKIRKRISKRKSTIRTRLTDLPIPKHFTEQSHTISLLEFRIIDSVSIPRRGGDRLAMFKEKELMWIHKLDRLAPKGLNLDFKLHA